MAASDRSPFTGCDHAHDERVLHAGRWYDEHRDTCPRPIVGHLRRMFGLTPAEAIEAIRQAQTIRSSGDADVAG